MHPRNITFPGELLLELAADALAVAGVTREQPLDYGGLFERFLPECAFRGRSDHQKRHYALRAVAMIHGGVRPDILEDTSWWNADDFWQFAVFAFVIVVRAAADRTGEPTSAIASRMATRRDVALGVT